MDVLFPVFLKLSGRKALVVGGGRMATMRAKQLLAAGAQVTVVAAKAGAELTRFAALGKLQLIVKAFEPGDLSPDYLLVVGATNQAAAQRAIAKSARALRVLCSLVDAPERSDFYTPAVVERGNLKIAICTSGSSPTLSGRLRRRLDEALPASAADWTRAFGHLRQQLLKAFPADPRKRRALTSKLIEKAALE
jgi:siroheme synthase-like protein